MRSSMLPLWPHHYIERTSYVPYMCKLLPQIPSKEAEGQIELLVKQTDMIME